MSLAKLFKKVLIPCAAGVGAVAANDHTLGPNCVKRIEKKPSELPIYSSECTVCGAVSKKPESASQLEETVGQIRKELWVWQDNVRGYRQQLVDSYQTGINKANFAVDYLREETHGPERAGAIALSGVTGYIFGLRKGVIRRFLYTTSGALAMAAVCYPNDAAEYADEIAQEAKRYFIIAYHFVFGDPAEKEVEVMNEMSYAKQLKGLTGIGKKNLCNCKFDPRSPKPCMMNQEGVCYKKDHSLPLHL